MKLRLGRLALAKSKDAKTSDPYLFVSIRTPRKTFRRLEQLAFDLIPRFGEAGLHLLISGWHEDGENIRIINLWKLDSANSLVTAELRLVDDPEYLELDGLLAEEDKQIVISVTDVSLVGEVDSAVARRAKEAAAARRLKKVAPPSAEGDRYVYVVVTNHVDTSDLAEFRARYEARGDAFRNATGWLGGDGFLGLTGQDDIVYQVWRVPEQRVTSVADLLTRTPWDDVSDENATFEILQPSAFDQLMPLPRI